MNARLSVPRVSSSIGLVKSRPKTSAPVCSVSGAMAKGVMDSFLHAGGRHGTRLKPSPLSITAKRPPASCVAPTKLSGHGVPLFDYDEGETPALQGNAT